ncbi:hypothetical protein [Streptomyces sp. NPDC050485]|uniref:hypothetical protein n=1 Tax=Streptomyces sp. NPDC050485 TaxID=3365617 RepID=UPI00378D7310
MKRFFAQLGFSAPSATGQAEEGGHDLVLDQMRRGEPVLLRDAFAYLVPGGSVVGEEEDQSGAVGDDRLPALASSIPASTSDVVRLALASASAWAATSARVGRDTSRASTSSAYA